MTERSDDRHCPRSDISRNAAGRAIRDGFTLIEVMGAVAILGIWFVVLATVAMQGMRVTGDSQRRLDASLLADSVLAEIELRAASGEILEVGEEEREEDPFTVWIELRDLNDSESVGLSSEETGDLIAFFAEQSDSPFMENRDSNWLLTWLREVRIAVTWQDGPEEVTIHRTAYIWDKAGWEAREDGGVGNVDF